MAQRRRVPAKLESPPVPVESPRADLSDEAVRKTIFFELQRAQRRVAERWRRRYLRPTEESAESLQRMDLQSKRAVCDKYQITEVEAYRLL